VTRLVAVGCGAVLLALTAGAPETSEARQTGKTYRLAVLSTTSAARFVDQIAAFRQGLRDFGYKPSAWSSS
jgi:hypothetical protein